MQATASWATATCGTSCCRRRSRPWLAARRRCVGWRRPQPRSRRRRRVWSWGWGMFGMLGHGDERQAAAAEEDRGPCWPARRRGLGWAAPQHRHHCGRQRLELGQWRSGKLGHGDRQQQLLPKKVEALAGRRVVVVSAWRSAQHPPLPPTAPSGAGAMESLANWATATRRPSRYRRRSRPLLGSASSLCRLESTTASPSPPTAVSGAGATDEQASWATATRRPVAAEEGRGLGWPARRRCVGGSIPQPRTHGRWRCLCLGQGRPRLPRTRRGPVGPAAAQEGGGMGAVTRRAL